MNDVIRTSKEYNERYRRTRPVMYGDIESLYMALSATDDYLLWLTHVQGWTLPGSGALIRQQVADARAIAKALYGAGPDEVNAPETPEGHDPRVMCPAEADVQAIDSALGTGWTRRLVENLRSNERPSEKASE